MQGQQNNIVKQQLIRQLKQFQSKQTMIQFYMSYDFPEKQKAVKAFWQDLIQNVIKKKNQIYITFKDLQTVTNIHGMKPVPIKNVLKQLKKQFVYLKQEDITQQKKPQKKVKPNWYSSIISFAWAKNDKDDVDNPFTFDPQEKIISTKIKQRKKRQLTNYFQKQFAQQNSKFLRNFLKDISWALKIDEESVDLLLKQLRRQKQAYIGDLQNVGDQVLIYSPDRKKMSDQNFIKVQKIKCQLKGTLQGFEHLYEKSSAKFVNLKQKAKQAVLHNDMTKARVLVAQAHKQDEHRDKIHVRKQILQQRIAQIEVNEMNKSSIDLLQEAQVVYDQIAVDPQKFQQVFQKQKDIQMQSDQANMRFQQLAASDIDDEVNNMMKQLEEEQINRRTVQPKRIRVDLPFNNQKMEIHKEYHSYN